MKRFSRLKYLPKSPWFVVGLYAFFGLIWIKYSDSFLAGIASNAEQLSRLQTLKGSLFIIITSVLLLLLVKSNIKTNLLFEDERKDFMTRTPLPLMVIKGELKISFLNQSFIKTYKYPLDRIPHIDAFWEKALPDKKYREKILSKINGLLDNQNSYLEFEIVDMQGEIHEIRFFSIDQITRKIFLFLDITEENRLKEEILQKDKSRIISQLAGGFVHDFKNQLFVIQAVLESIELEDENPLHKEKYETIINAVNHSNELSKQLLLLSKKEKIQHKPVDLSELARDIDSMVRHTLPRNIHFHIIEEDTHLQCMGDKSLLYNGVLNLIFNARDAMSSGGELVLIFNKSQNNVHIEVKDTGSGITSEELNRVMEPFYSTKKEKGTGLGLATLQSTIEKHKGSIEIKSQPKVGTSVKLSLPRYSES